MVPESAAELAATKTGASAGSSLLSGACLDVNESHLNELLETVWPHYKGKFQNHFIQKHMLHWVGDIYEINIEFNWLVALLKC